ncbi:MAG: CBS domain-containing protein [Candidatus Thermoplasmatota archaeon]|nr:CBS domain-containing protein [Candidatus Thermoplasmatota archaeon]
MDSRPDRMRWMSVNNAMTRDVILVKESSRVKDAWITLMESGISGAPVVDDTGSLVGILSVTDIFRSIIDKFQKARSLREATATTQDAEAAEKEELRELSLAIRAVSESSVQAIISRDKKLLTLSPEDSFERAIRMMAEHGVNRLPVVKGNHVVGILTRQDIIWHIGGRPGKSQDQRFAQEPSSG